MSAPKAWSGEEDILAVPKPVDKRKRVRVQFMVLSSLALFFFFFIYDTPSPIYAGLNKMFGGEYPRQHPLLYSAYALPNLFLPLLVSMAIENPSTRTMLCAYTIIALGHAVFCLGAWMEGFEWMVAGRFIIGLGGESFSVAQNKVLVQLFSSAEHGFVLGVSLAVARLGTITAYLVLRTCVVSWGVFFCTMVGMGLLLVGVALCAFIDTRAGISEKLLLHDSGESACPVGNHHLLPHVLGVAIIVACAVSPFASSSSDIFSKRLGVSYSTASKLLALQECVSLVLTPAVGYFTDRIGHRLSCVILGTTLLAMGHSLVLLGHIHRVLPPLILGTASAFLACCWPCIPLLLAPESMAFGLSILSCGVNLAYTVCPWLASRFNDSEYRFSEFYTVVMSVVASTLSITILLINSRMCYGLNGRRRLAQLPSSPTIRKLAD